MESKVKYILSNINSLRNFENFIKINKNNIVFLCVGNGDVWYDSFGPLLGDQLKNHYNIKTFIYGDMNNYINTL